MPNARNNMLDSPMLMMMQIIGLNRNSAFEFLICQSRYLCFKSAANGQFFKAFSPVTTDAALRCAPSGVVCV